MGYNTVAFFLNDQSSEIERDPLTLRRLKDAMAGGMGNTDRQYMTILPSVHADGDQVILAGGNRVTALTVLWGCDHTEEGLLRALADRLGYSLRKKPRRSACTKSLTEQNWTEEATEGSPANRVDTQR